MSLESVTFTDDPDAFLKETLPREILRSERQRITLTLGFLWVAGVAFAIAALVPALVADSTREHFLAQAPAVVALFVAAIAYESVILALVGRFLREGRQPPAWTRYANAFVEVSMPTVTLLIAATVFGPVQALAAAPSRFYFLFIIIAALQLDFRLCAFSGAVAAVQYAATAAALLKGVDRSIYPELLTDLGHQLALAGLLLLAGLVAGFVAAQIRRQLAAALTAADERHRTIGLFGQYVSPEVVERVLHQPVGFGGELRDVSVMFLDIRDFSEMAREHSPTEVMEYLNAVFGGMIEIVNRHHGILNKFLGDGFMAIFGAPADDARHCTHAVQAGLEILAEVQRLNAPGDLPETRVGIGIHMGEVVTGNVGSARRKEYTIIGDVVNLAARIESATKQFGAQMLISADVRDRLDPGAYPTEDLGPVALKGQKDPLPLHRVA